jgi:hypothetical protein
MKRYICLASLLLALASGAQAQTQQVFPRIRVSFPGSTTLPSLDVTGWTIWRTSAVTPAVSAAGTMRLYFNGTNWMISENGAAFHVVGPSLPTSVFTSLGAFQTQTANTVFSGPVSGGAAVPTFRTLVVADIPALPYFSTTATQTANTFLLGPTTGAAAAPTFRSMVLADIPDGLITFAKWAAQCAANEIPKRNAGNTAWVCGVDNTSPGGTAWVTAGNTSVVGGLLGTNDANAFAIITNGVARANVTTTGVDFWQPSASLPAGNAAATGTTTFLNSVRHNFTSRYWTGAASASNTFSLEAQQNTATATDAQLQFRFNGTAIGYMDSGGNVGGLASVASSSFLGAHAFVSTARASPGVSAAATGRIHFNSTTNKYMVSENGGAEVPMIGQGSTVWCDRAATDAQLPGSGYAYVQFRQDREYLAFDDGATSTAYFTCTMPSNYDATTLAVVPHWTSSTTTGNVTWGIAIENQTSVSQNTAFGATETTAAQGLNSIFVLNTSITANITNTNAGSPAAYSRIRIRVRRLGADAGDTMAVTVELYGLMVRK